MNASEMGIIVSFIVSIAIMIGGFVFSKRSKSSVEVKRNVAMGTYLLGGASLIINGFQLWQMINGTYIHVPLPDLSDITSASNTSAYAVELFGTSINLFHLINIGAGIVVIIIGLLFKQKKWSKVAGLLGVMAIVAGVFQIFL